MKREAVLPVGTLPIASIKVGERFRQQMGDLDGLAASIREHGLLHPIVVTPERLLIAGERRLLAATSLGWSEIPVTVIDARDLLGAEAAENRDRLNFTPSEAVAIADALRPLVATPVGRPSEKSRQITGITRGETRDKVAAAVGMSGRTLEKAAAVVRAAEADPDLGSIAAEMDSTGNVERAYQKVQKATGGTAEFPMTDVHRAKFPQLALDQERVKYTASLYASAATQRFRPEEWAERVARLPAEDVARIRQHFAHVRRWLDEWDQVLARPALSLVKET